MRLRASTGRSTPGARCLTVALALLLLLAGVAVAGPAHAAAAGDFVTAINSARSTNGLPALAVSSDLTAAAQKQANAMAAAGKLFHTPNLGRSLCCWTAVGENVGYGADVKTIHTMFMASGPHKKNILDAGYTQVGVGVVNAGATLYVAEVFRAANGTMPAPKASPKPKTTTAPKASSSPKPTASTKPAGPAQTTSGTPPAVPEPPVAAPAVPPALLALRTMLAQFLAEPTSLPGVDPVSRGLDFAAAVGSISD